MRFLFAANAVTLLVLRAFDWQPLLSNLRQGQIHTLVALLITASWYCLSLERDWEAGILVGLAALLKMFLGLIFFWLLLRRRRALFAALSMVVLASILLYLFRGSGGFGDYLNVVRTYGDYFGPNRQNYSLSSVVPYVIAGPTGKSLLASVMVMLSEILLFGYTTYLTLRKRNPTHNDIALEFSAFILLACLLSPTLEAFYYPILLLPLAIAASEIRSAAALRSSIILLAILLCFSGPEQIIWRPMQLIAPPIGDRLSFLLFSFPTLATLTLWFWIVRCLKREYQPTELLRNRAMGGPLALEGSSP